jgi:hypothetical protein
MFSLIGFYLVDNHPIKIEEKENGNVVAISINSKTGEFFENPKYITEIAFGNGDIEQVSQKEYEYRINKILKALNL